MIFDFAVSFSVCSANKLFRGRFTRSQNVFAA